MLDLILNYHISDNYSFPNHKEPNKDNDNNVALFMVNE